MGRRPPLVTGLTGQRFRRRVDVERAGAGPTPRPAVEVDAGSRCSATIAVEVVAVKLGGLVDLEKSQTPSRDTASSELREHGLDARSLERGGW